MELKFLGKGSAFNTPLGNTSAYMESENQLLLIDCGGTVFHRLMEQKLLEQKESVHIVITHTHPDHVGSLGELIFYAYYVMKIEVKIYFPDQPLMIRFLECIGVETNQYALIPNRTSVIEWGNIEPLTLDFVPVTHVTTMPSFGLLLSTPSSRIYYSGDANEIPDLILEQFKNILIDRLYQDTSGLDYLTNPHLPFDKLVQLIPDHYRHKVVCIHHDIHLDLKKVVALGFQLPQ